MPPASHRDMPPAEPSLDPAPRPKATGWRANLPNALTIFRLVLAAAFVAVLSIHTAEAPTYWALPVAAGLFIIAAATDALDGWLARRWNAISVFGRVMDPFADKVLVLGAFVLLAGPGFAWGEIQTSGVLPWMAIVILARELLITSLRSLFESAGVDFSASLSGKFKMIAQSVAVPIILIAADRAVVAGAGRPEGAPLLIASGVAWLTVLITVWSAIPYLARALRARADLG